ncbi:MAG: hypothetical protein Kapaf2KO_15750 [Candidatus Kapaibacteriales bacterium]
MTSALNSTIFSKIVVALTGLIMYGFVLGHLTGNLLIFQGAEPLNAYGQFLVDLGGGLWIARIVLLVSVLLHIVYTLKLNARNKMARKDAYKKWTPKKSTIASRWMVTAGITIMLFIILHLMHFTWGIIPVVDQQFELADGRMVHDIYSMVVAGFQNILYVIIYVLAIIGLSLHLKHGFHSVFQTLGFHGPELTPKLQKVGLILAIIIAVGYISIPISVIAGIVKPLSGSAVVLLGL